MGTVITFYSYKGGVGRTFAMANIAALLAMNGKRILCIDWDLEAPGLEFYFGPYYSNDKTRRGIVELITELKDNPEEDWRNYCIAIRWNKPFIGSFDFIPAGSQDATYTTRMQDLNWESLYKESQLGEKLERLREEWVKEYDYVLIDSRAGVTDIGGICTIQMPDILFTFATANKQSIDGTVNIINKILKARSEMIYPRAYLNSVPVLTRVDKNERDLQKKWEDIFIKETEDIYGEWLQIGADSGDLLKRVYIPYYPFYSYGEELPVIEDNLKTENINTYFENLTALIIHGLSDTQNFINDRDKYVTDALIMTKKLQTIPVQNETIELVNSFDSYIDLILEGKEHFANATSYLQTISSLQESISQSMRSSTGKLKAVTDSPSKDKLITIKNIMDELANDLDNRFQSMYTFITYLETELLTGLDYYRKGYNLFTNVVYRPLLEIDEMINFKLSLNGLVDNLTHLQKSMEDFKISFSSLPPSTKTFNRVQKKAISIIGFFIDVSGKLSDKSREFISYLNDL